MIIFRTWWKPPRQPKGQMKPGVKKKKKKKKFLPRAERFSQVVLEAPRNLCGTLLFLFPSNLQHWTAVLKPEEDRSASQADFCVLPCTSHYYLPKRETARAQVPMERRWRACWKYHSWLLKPCIPHFDGPALRNEKWHCGDGCKEQRLLSSAVNGQINCVHTIHLLIIWLRCAVQNIYLKKS